MAYIRELASGHWQACWRDTSGRIRTKAFGKREKSRARTYANDQESAVRRGAYVDPALARTPVDEFWRTFITSAEGHLRPTSAYEYKGTYRRHIKPTLGGRAIGSVTRGDIEDLIAALAASGAGASTRAATIRLLKRIFSSAIERDLLLRHPCKGIRMPNEPARPITPSSLEQVLRIAAHIDGYWRAAVLLSGLGGLRIGEVFALEVGHFDWLPRRVNIMRSVAEIAGSLVVGPPKGGNHRTITLPAFVVDDLAEHLAKWPAPGGVIFGGARGYRHPSNFRSKVWRPAVRELGLEGFRFHDLRHAAVSISIEAGASLKAVQAVAGHSSAAITADRYAHLLPTVTDEVARRLDSMVRTHLEASAAEPLLESETGEAQ